MKTYTATVIVTMYQTITVEAEDEKDAELKMIERFNQSTANFDPAEVYDMEEVQK